MSDAQAEMMAKWVALSSAGAAHKVLDPLVGTWDQEVCFWFGPGAPPQRSKGESVIEWSLGGRFLVQRFKGLSPGSDFAGLGVSGYDNVRKEYVNFWCDSMSTAFMVTRGLYDAAGRVGTMHGTHDDAMSGRRDVPHRTVTTIESKDRNVYEMLMPGPDGKEFKSLEVISTRRGGM